MFRYVLKLAAKLWFIYLTSFCMDGHDMNLIKKLMYSSRNINWNFIMQSWIWNYFFESFQLNIFYSSLCCTHFPLVHTTVLPTFVQYHFQFIHECERDQWAHAAYRGHLLSDQQQRSKMSSTHSTQYGSPTSQVICIYIVWYNLYRKAAAKWHAENADHKQHKLNVKLSKRDWHRQSGVSRPFALSSPLSFVHRV